MPQWHYFSKEIVQKDSSMVKILLNVPDPISER